MAETPRRRASDKRFLDLLWAKMKEQPMVALLVLAVVLQALMLTLGVAVLNPRASHNADRIEALAEQNSVLIRENAKAQLAQCQRGNVTRPQTIRAYTAIAKGNRARAKGWAAIAAAFPDTAPVVEDSVEANLEEAHDMSAIARNIANAQREVSLYPNSNDLEKRALVDCEGQFG